MPKTTNTHSSVDANSARIEGKHLRKQTPRSSHGDWRPVSDRTDPIDLLQEQDKGRLQHLLPIKYGRMMASPFAFLRGSAVVMAADLSSTPVTGLDTVICGDAHLANFGLFATPERNVVFDVNDFDETYPGPWEWDLKRLATSAVIAGRGNGFHNKTCGKLATVVSRAYREAMQRFAAMSIMEVWYYQVNAASVVDLFDTYAKKSAEGARKTLRKARTHTSEHTLAKLTHIVDGQPRFINSPPVLVRMADLMTDEEKRSAREQGSVDRAWEAYKRTVPEERRRLLSRYRVADAALRVGGVGSVGTRCAIALLEGERPEDALILQQKEVGASCLQAYLPDHGFSSQAQRVIVGQRLMQASSDIFLGFMDGESGIQYYWRQFKDMKGEFDVTTFGAKGLATYLAVCGACLARAHARAGGSAAIAGYLGKSTTFDKAIRRFAVAYADQTERDHMALLDAIDTGRIVASPGV